MKCEFAGARANRWSRFNEQITLCLLKLKSKEPKNHCQMQNKDQIIQRLRIIILAVNSNFDEALK